MQMFERPDGRLIAYEIWGDETGKPVLFSHGTGDSRLARNPREKLTEEIGVRLITVDRPGVGGSSPKPDRTILDWAADIEALMDFLSLERFAVAGHAGGGPYALGMAYRFGDRVSRVVLASPIGPLNEPRALKMLLDKDLKSVALLRHTHWLLSRGLRHEIAQAGQDIPGFVESLARRAPSDAATLVGDPEMREMFEEEMEAAFGQGEQAVVDDTNALFDWGFAPEAVRQPVALFYGDADELLDPAMPKRLGARLPDCRITSWPGAGHYACFDRWQEFLRAAL
jgi:pimeloyl-ACP methyl ester carboxylesterase